MNDELEKRPLPLVASLSPAAEAALKQRADALQLDVPTYAAKLVEHMAASMVSWNTPIGHEKVILDAQVIYEGFLKPQSLAGKCLERAEERQFYLWVDGWILAEVRGLRHKYLDEMKLTEEQMKECIKRLRVVYEYNFIDEIDEAAIDIEYEPSQSESAQVCINLAEHCAGQSETAIIVTKNVHLLERMNIDTREGRDFMLRYPSIRILDVESFARMQEEAERIASGDTTFKKVARQREQSHVRDVARQAEEASRLSRVMDRLRGQHKEKGHEK